MADEPLTSAAATATTATTTAADSPPPATHPESDAQAAPLPLPRIAIRFCTQCKWMLRAAYVSKDTTSLPNVIAAQISESQTALSLSLSVLPHEHPRRAPTIYTQVLVTNRKPTPPHQFAQELLSTFSTSLGEVALIPSTGGTFTVTITTAADAAPASNSTSTSTSTSTKTLWDRKTDGGFPETKELKRRVRNVIDPSRNLGHVDRDHARPAPAPASADTVAMPSSASTGAAAEAPAQSQGTALDDEARSRIAAARTNKGQAAPSGVDGASLVSELKGPGPAQTQAQASREGQTGEAKAVCGDCV
ncbi:selT/selW/selH selenoprotein domain-containing protein [Verticillium dahliae]